MERIFLSHPGSLAAKNCLRLHNELLGTMSTRMCVLLRESGRYRSHPVRITSFSPHVSKKQEFHFQIILGVIKFCLSVRVSLGVFLSRQAGIPRISSFPIVFSSSSLSQTVFHPHPPPPGDTSTDQLGSECIITSSSRSLSHER